MSSVSAPVGPLGPRGQQGGATRPLAPEPPLGLHPAGCHFRSLPAVPQAGAVLCGGGGGRCVLPARPGAWGMPHPSGGARPSPAPPSRGPNPDPDPDPALGTEALSLEEGRGWEAVTLRIFTRSKSGLCPHFWHRALQTLGMS